MSIALDLYIQLVKAGTDRVEAMYIAEALETIDRRYPQARDIPPEERPDEPPPENELDIIQNALNRLDVKLSRHLNRRTLAEEKALKGS